MFWIVGPHNLSFVQAVVRNLFRKITNFEFELDDWLMNDLWQFNIEEELVYFYEACGYDSNILMFTMGLELYLFWIVFVVLAVIMLTKGCCSCKEKMQKF
jgi:hypothetical protein